MGNVEQTLQCAVHETSIADVLQAASPFWRVLIFLFQLKILNCHLESRFTKNQVPRQILLLTILRAVGYFLTLALDFQSFDFVAPAALSQFVHSTIKSENELARRESNFRKKTSITFHSEFRFLKVSHLNTIILMKWLAYKGYSCILFNLGIRFNCRILCFGRYLLPVRNIFFHQIIAHLLSCVHSERKAPQSGWCWSTGNRYCWSKICNSLIMAVRYFL